MSLEDMLPVPTEQEHAARRVDLFSRARTVRARRNRIAVNRECP
ncbi:hypothetical protein ACFWPX_29815 [Nocardia sp. NPDC058518]